MYAFVHANAPPFAATIALTRYRSFIARTALRIVSRQPSRPLASLQQHASRAAVAPVVSRSFHLTAAWRAEPTQQQEQEPIVEKSVATSETADASLTEKAKYAASNALDSLQSAVSSNSSSRPAQRSTSVYVGNLLFEIKSADLEAEFAACGTVVSARVIEDGRGLSKGFGFVEFQTPEQAEQAIRDMNQQDFNGRRITVQPHTRHERSGASARDNRPTEPTATLFIGNMSYEMSDRDLNDLFREIRDVLDVRVAIDRRTGQPRGFAHADFVSVAAATKAKETLEGKLVYGRNLRVDFSTTSRLAATRNNSRQ